MATDTAPVTLTLTPGEDSIQSIRALSAYCATRGPGEPLTAAVDRIGEALRYGHPVTVTIGDATTDTAAVDRLLAAWNDATLSGGGFNGGDAVDLIGELLTATRADRIIPDDAGADPCEYGTCTCVTYPHAWGPSGQRCTRCPAAGTGDPCGDGDCTGHPDNTDTDGSPS